MAWMKAAEDELDALEDWNNEFAEIRFVRLSHAAVHLYLLSSEPQPNGEIGAEMLGWREALEAEGLSVTGEVLSYDVFSVTQLETTKQLDLEWASEDEGGSGDAAAPALTTR